MGYFKMSDLDIEFERKKVELMRVQMAKAEMEFVIKERTAEIDRIKKNIEIQNSKIEELKQIISEKQK